MSEQNETQQPNPIDTLKQILSIAQDLHDFATLLDTINPGYVMRETAKITALVDDLLEGAAATKQISDRGVSYWLKFCDPLPDVDEKDLIPRSWSISKEELGSDG